jgi:hypothetical protein
VLTIKDDMVTSDQADREVGHVLSHAADLLMGAPRDWIAGWIGGRPELYRLFQELWASLGFSGRILVPEWAAHMLTPAIGEPLSGVSIAELGSVPDLIVVDFGVPSDDVSTAPSRAGRGRLDRAISGLVGREFADLVAAERVRSTRDGDPRRFLCIDALGHDERLVVNELALDLSAVTASGRLRHGYVKKRVESRARTAGVNGGSLPRTTFQQARDDGSRGMALPDAIGPRSGAGVPAGAGIAFLSSGEVAVVTHRDGPPANAISRQRPLIEVMHVGESGERIGTGIVAPFGRRGVVLHGPHVRLPPGDYRFDVRVAPRSPWALAALARPVIIDVCAGSERLVQRRLHFFLRGTLCVPFTVRSEVPDGYPIYLRMFRGRYIDFVVTGIRLMRMAHSPPLYVPAGERRALLEMRDHPEGAPL